MAVGVRRLKNEEPSGSRRDHREKMLFQARRSLSRTYKMSWMAKKKAKEV